ncbi:MAG: AAA family ATPase [archaeon]|nr:AAA family ATPase [Candidatus Micrarchaeota archaeon]
MKVIITGVPGSGKSILAKRLGKKLGMKVINEKSFSERKGIGKKEKGELVVPLERLERELKKELEKKKSVIIEGHLLAEVRLPVEKVFLVRVNPEELEKRLRKRNYSELKTQENVFCEETNYLGKQLKKNYPKEKIVEIKSDKKINNTLGRIIKEIRKGER